ncbi:MAG: Hpt domain-containing protein [Chlorobi bacterium]|nr:Hpt domain-containing protein [Chlorobiota bacterium]
MSGQTITDLSYLKEVSSEDPEFMKEMIGIFKEQVPEFIANMEKFYQSGQYIELGKEAHKAKSSVIIVGMNDLGVKMKELQILTEKNEKVESYPDYIEDFKTKCLQAITELDEFMKGL